MQDPTTVIMPRRAEGPPTSRGARKPSRFHQRLLAEELTNKRTAGGLERVAPALAEACVDLNPHQLQAVTFALESLATGGCILGDEVGLGKTVEAGLALAQLIAEGRSRILILAPAPLRAQWRDEMWDKFGLTTECVDGPSAKASGRLNPFDSPVPIICSVPFMCNRSHEARQIPWDLVIIDEAHRLRNSYKRDNKTGRALREAIAGVPKLLLTATPLQNSIMELYGLASLIDETLFGPEDAFRQLYGALLQPPPPNGAPDEKEIVAERLDLMNDLKERLAPIINRTLRRQVREYVKYTNRRSIVEDFRPNDAEQLLYDKVSAYLTREELAAIAPERRTLLTLCYRKILGSSSFAVAATLEKLANSLEAKVGAAEKVMQAQGTHIEQLLVRGEENEDDQDGLEDEIRRIYEEEAEELIDDGQIDKRKPMTLSDCKEELKELRSMVALARSIKVNAKGEALRRAISRSFTVAAAHGWPQKAVIFTESRRTQEYLKVLLEEDGFEGEISILCGDGSGPDERKALVDDFRDRTRILISTEAGAEGLNLQFCNLLINYDLPWNPQRVEQRIGRCHRYGQKRDVLVINMVNRSNAAEARLYDLLEQKLQLFDGVFGASDDVLGALDSGVDFERRVLDIYQSCRSERAIDDAFNTLRAEMETKISARMAETRAMVTERFDDQVKARLKGTNTEVRQVLKKSEAQAKAIALSVLGLDDASETDGGLELKHLPAALVEAAGGAEIALGSYSFGSATDAREKGLMKLGPGSALVKAAAKMIKSQPLDEVSYLKLDAGSAPPQISGLFGKEGYWYLYRLLAGEVDPDERIVHVVLVREGNVFRSLDPETGALFVEVPARETVKRPESEPTGATLASAKESALLKAQMAVKVETEARRGAAADKARERWDRFTEECLEKPRRRLADARAKWELARKLVLSTQDDRERLKLRRDRDAAEREYKRQLDQMRLEEQRRMGDKERALVDVQKKATIGEVKRVLLATSYWFFE